MFNVMKAQKYQLLRSKSTYIILFLCLLFLVIGTIMEIGSQGDNASASTMYTAMAESYTLFIPMLVMAYTATVCGSDLNDKTINHEMLTGTDRKHIYFGRVFMSLIVNLIAIVLVLIVPILLFTAFMGWGHTITPRDLALRFLAAFFPMLRLTAFYAFMTFLLKSGTAVYAIGYILTFLEMIAMVMIEELFSTKVLMYILSVDALERILIPQNYGYGFFEDKDVMIVKDVMETSTVVHAASSGIIGTAVFLIAGYMIFRKRDMD